MMHLGVDIIVKLISRIQIRPAKDQARLLVETIERSNAACNYANDYAWENKEFSQYRLQKAVYYDIKALFGLSAQATVQAVKKVTDAYKTDRERKRTFRKRGAIAYDSRILTYFTERNEVSLWTVGGRQRMPFVCRERQRLLLASQKGESDLIWRKGKLYLLATCTALVRAPRNGVDVVGVDRGISRITTDSDGDHVSGEEIETKRAWYTARRATLQKVGTKSAKRRLKHLSGRQRRFQRDANHVISKKLVEKAKDTNRAIALEDLSGIRRRTTVRKSQRSRHSNWAYAQLRNFIAYKAQLVGVPVIFVDPRDTSRTCSSCGHCEKANRKSQAEFACRSCGNTMNADESAALDIRARGKVNSPMVAEPTVTYGAAA